MPLRAWNKFDFFDPETGDMAVRYTGFSGRGTFSMTLPATPGGKSRREQKEWALTLIEEAIDSGEPPGDVAYREPPPKAAFGF